MNFLIIEDDIFLWNKLKSLFEKTFFINEVSLLKNYLEFLDHLSIINVYDIILIDINLWFDSLNWIDILKIIRKKNIKIPIIMISWIDEISTIWKTFDFWATDYIVKPFRLEELKVRVFKYFKINFFNLNFYDKPNFEYNGLVYDINLNEFSYLWNHIKLTKKNKYLLSILISNNEKFLSKEYLYNKLFLDYENINETNNVRIYIFRLKKILSNFWIENWINCVRWEWYIFKK